MDEITKSEPIWAASIATSVTDGGILWGRVAGGEEDGRGADREPRVARGQQQAGGRRLAPDDLGDPRDDDRGDHGERHEPGGEQEQRGHERQLDRRGPGERQVDPGAVAQREQRRPRARTRAGRPSRPAGRARKRPTTAATSPTPTTISARISARDSRRSASSDSASGAGDREREIGHGGSRGAMLALLRDRPRSGALERSDVCPLVSVWRAADRRRPSGDQVSRSRHPRRFSSSRPPRHGGGARERRPLRPARVHARSSARFGDSALYTLAPDGGFEAGAAGWTRSAGATVVGESSTIKLGPASGTKSLQLAAGASATSPAICVERGFSGFRFVARSAGAAQGAGERRGRCTPRARSRAAGAIKTTAVWGATRSVKLVEGQFKVKAGESTTLRLKFTASGGPVRIDDVYIDPRLRG